MPTSRTAFTCRLPPINLDQSTARPFSFILKLTHNLHTSHIINTLGKMTVLHHVFDGEAFHANHLVFADDACGELVLIISPLISNAGMKACHFAAGLLPILAALLLLGMSALG